MKTTVCFVGKNPEQNRFDLEPVEAIVGEKLSELLPRVGRKLASDCGGRGVCRKCRLSIARLPNGWSDTMPTASALSLDTLRETYSFEEVLACQTVVSEPLLVLLPDEFRSRGASEQILLDTTPKDRYRPDTHRHTLADSARRLLHHAEPQTTGSSGRYGAAVDLGTTTLVVALVDLKNQTVVARAAAKNPQILFGSDVISRIERAGRSPESLAVLQKTVLSQIASLLETVAEQGHISPDRIERMTVAGNTVMEYLFLGLDPAPLGRTPFVPPVTLFEPVAAETLDLPIAAKAPVTVFPVLTGFIGGDLVAGLLALRKIGRRRWFSRPELLIDIGTNGEMLLLCNGKIYAASTAAGPVFEGAHIRFGTFAATGAIEGVHFSPVPYWEQGLFAKVLKRSVPQIQIKTIGNAPATGICGSGLVDSVAELLRLELMTPNGRILSADRAIGKKERGRLGEFENQRAFLLAGQAQLAPAIWLTQNDVRQVQLAVGAIRAGVEFLLKKANITFDQVHRLNLAGGFGNYLRRENAQRIGLLPPEIPTQRMVYCGNTSLLGAVELLCYPKKFRQTADCRNQAVHIELENEPLFAERFAQAMVFPENFPG